MNPQLYEGLASIGEGGQGSIRLLEVDANNKFVIKIYQFKLKDVHKNARGFTIT